MVFSWQGAEHFAAPEPQQLIVSLIPYMIVNILQHRCIIWAMFACADPALSTQGAEINFPPLTR